MTSEQMAEKFYNQISYEIVKNGEISREAIIEALSQTLEQYAEQRANDVLAATAKFMMGTGAL